MAAAKVLVIDDELEVRDFLTSILKDENFDVLALEDGRTLVENLNTFQPNMVLLDYRIPGQKSGVELISAIKANDDFKDLPIIMVTGVDGENEKVDALEMGADDYLVKPFLPKELGARIRAVLRRTQETSGEEDVLENNGLQVDLRSHRVTLDGGEVSLTLTEFKILGELLKQKGQVLSRDKLRQTALGNLNVTDRTIDVHMASLRKKLTRCGDDIQTVRGVGYRMSMS